MSWERDSAFASSPSSSGSITFSSAVREASSWNDWNTKPTFIARRRARASSSSEVSAAPSSVTSPLLGVSRPARIASSVDLPEPLAPTTATASPRVTSRSISRKITRSLAPLFTVLPMPRAVSTLLLFIVLPLWVVLLLPAFAAPAAEKSILVLGDSLSAAYGIARERGWVALLEERLKRERLDYSVVNASISGDTSGGGRARLKPLLERHRPAVVIVELGGNDGLRGLPVTQMRTSLGAIIRESQSAGARVLLVGVKLPPNYGEVYTSAFEAAYRELPKTHRTALVPFILEDFAGNPVYFQAYRLHPTEAAQPLMLERVWKELKPLLSPPLPNR